MLYSYKYRQNLDISYSGIRNSLPPFYVELSPMTLDVRRLSILRDAIGDSLSHIQNLHQLRQFLKSLSHVGEGVQKEDLDNSWRLCAVLYVRFVSIWNSGLTDVTLRQSRPQLHAGAKNETWSFANLTAPCDIKDNTCLKALSITTFAGVSVNLSPCLSPPPPFFASFFRLLAPIDPDNLPIYIREYQPITIPTHSTHREWNSIRGIKERGVQIRVYETSCAVSQPGSLGKIHHLPGMLHFDFTSTSASGKVRLRCVLIREIRQMKKRIGPGPNHVVGGFQPQPSTCRLVQDRTLQRTNQQKQFLRGHGQNNWYNRCWTLRYYCCMQVLESNGYARKPAGWVPLCRRVTKRCRQGMDGGRRQFRLDHMGQNNKLNTVNIAKLFITQAKINTTIIVYLCTVNLWNL